MGPFLYGWLFLMLALPASAWAAGYPQNGADEVDGADGVEAERPTVFKKPAIIEFKGEINYALTRYFFNRFEQAQRSGVDLLVIEIDSPGGLKFESLKIAEALSQCDWAYTVAFIPQEAISGGALVALGCDQIIIAPDAKLGNIGEIGFDMEAMAFRLIRPKVESSLAHDARKLAAAKGRSEDLAEAFVDKDILVYWRLNDEGQIDFRQTRVDDPNQPQAPWELIPETKPERFMLLSGRRAKELAMADDFAENREELAINLGTENKSFRIYKYSTNDSIVHWLNNPLITGLLIVIGLVALYIEFVSPGLGAGGLIAALCMLLFFWSRYLGGTAGWLEVMLFVAGLSFLLMELFVIPGFGISGFLGIVLLFISVVLASQNFTVPQTSEQWNQSLGTSVTLLTSVAIFFIVASLLSRHLGSLPLLNRLVLEPPSLEPLDSSATASKDGLHKPGFQTHPAISVGDWGVTESALRPAGRAKFDKKSFDVVSDGHFVDSQKQVKVIRISGNIITVSEIEDASEINPNQV